MIFFMRLPEREGTVNRKWDRVSRRLIGMLRSVPIPPPRESTKNRVTLHTSAVYSPAVWAKEWSTGRMIRDRHPGASGTAFTASWQLVQ